MTLGEFRLATAGLPDDTEIVAHGGDGEHFETGIDWVLPPAVVFRLEEQRSDPLPHTICLSLRQPVGEDLDLWERTEANPMWRGPGE